MTPEDLVLVETIELCCAECAVPLGQSPSWTRSDAGELVCAECSELIEPRYEHGEPAA